MLILFNSYPKKMKNNFSPTKKEWQEVITLCDNLPKNAKFGSSTRFAFTEQGVAMLSSILNSDRAISVNPVPFTSQSIPITSNTSNIQRVIYFIG